MSAYAILVDLAALLAMAAGFLVAFRQALVRRWWRILHSQADAPAPPVQPEDDPTHYAMIIFGMMLLAFGLILFCFTTIYAVLTAG